MRIKILYLAIIFSNITVAATAQTAELASSQPPPELNRLEYFEGAWRCQQPAAPASPSGVFTWTVERDLNSFWYVGNAEEIESPDDGKPINSKEFLGYNVVSGKLIRSVFVGNGNFFNLTASDWQDGKLTWSGKVIDKSKGQSIPLREEIVQDSPDRFSATYFVPDDGGNWKPVVDETCDRIK